MKRALECCRDGGGGVPEGAGKTRTDQAATREGAAGAWRKSFLNAPYLRDVLVRAGLITETFETSITWDRFEEFHTAVTAATSDALKRVAGSGSVSCRFTHVYPDGPAPYYTVIGPGRRDGLLDQWAEIKAAASEALLREGGSITHHHAVGRDHRSWYDQQRPNGFARALAAAKAELGTPPQSCCGSIELVQQTAQRSPMPRMRHPLPSPDHRAVGPRQSFGPHLRGTDTPDGTQAAPA